MLDYTPTPVQELQHTLLDNAGIRLLIKREDLNHPHVTGNKWWKLRYNLQEAYKQGKKTLLTFGGAYSNHIYATAAAAQECSFQSIGIIRGERTEPLNATLAFAEACGMQLNYVSREDYRKKHEPDFIQRLQEQFGDFYLVPEGGSNALAVRGVKDFAETLKTIPFDILCSAVGTGGTLAGLIAGLNDKRSIIGFPALKGGDFLKEEITFLLKTTGLSIPDNWQLQTDFHFGGYGKVTPQLLAFLDEFEQTQGFQLDPIYTGKMMAGLFDLVRSNFFPAGKTILCIHTGGLQGWNGFL